ncbi:glycoside hydrolase family 38 N-terminal domain-containing protein [Bacteroides sp.]
MKFTHFLLATIVIVPFMSSCSQQAGSSGKEFPVRDTLGYKYIDIVHVSHTDYGYTDHPMIAIELQKRYLDIALDLALQTKDEKPEDRFVWTAETLDPMYLWWQDATERRRKEMQKMIENKQIGISAMPFHIHPFVNARQWEEMINWIPEELRSKLDIEVGMQHDVNGFPRAAALNLLNKNVKYLWTGINGAWGGSPFKLPTAFWWKMPDERKLLVWSGYPYWEGYTFFAPEAWRIDQYEAANTEFTWPRNGDILSDNEDNVRKAHEICINRLKDLRTNGYQYPFVILSFTNQWRMDNDGPIAQLQPFIKKWNELGLKPILRMSTSAEAMKDMEAEIGDSINTYEGEWQDWWSFGVAASPRELQAARRSVQYIKVSESNLWSMQSDTVKTEIKEINRMLCRYYEHTFGSNETSNRPYSLFNLGQLNEKGSFAYRPLERGKWLLAQLTRSEFTNKQPGIYVANTGKETYTGWVKLDASAFRGESYNSVKEANTNKQIPLFREGKEARFWVSNMKQNSYSHFTLQKDTAMAPAIPQNSPQLILDEKGWVNSVKWDNMKEPLFQKGLADFMVLTINEMNRWALADYIHWDSAARAKWVTEKTNTSWAQAKQKATMEETPYSYIIKQELEHPRVKGLQRQIEIQKESPRVKVKLSFNRLSSMTPEVFYVKFPFPESNKEIETTNGGIPLVPYKDHIPNSCKDFFVVDSWVKFHGSDGSRIWSSIDVPLVNFGGHNFLTRIQDAPKNCNELYGMLYNSLWVVNFSIDVPGEMSFEFDITFKEGNPSVEQVNNLTDTYMLPIPVMNNPEARENPVIGKHMNTPRLIKLTK